MVIHHKRMFMYTTDSQKFRCWVFTYHLERRKSAAKVQLLMASDIGTAHFLCVLLLGVPQKVATYLPLGRPLLYNY